MKTLAEGARRLPSHHITIRVPWHDDGWAGSVCTRPLENTSCLILPRIGGGKRDEVEVRCAGKRLDELDAGDLPPCVGERVSFMAPFEIRREMTHPYAKIFPDTHGHLARTSFVHLPYSAACVPYRWMLREKVEGNPKDGEIGLAERLRLGWVPDREPDIRNRSGKEVDTDWVQERSNQLTLLDTFFSALRPEESLCFFYAKRTPLSEQSRRVIIGVGRVLSVGEATEYAFSGDNPPLRCVLWERNVSHSVRSGFIDGFLFPYQEALALADREGIDPGEFVAFAPDEHFGAYSYGTELLTHDGAVASLIACAAALHRIRGRIEGPWIKALAWIDTQLNRLWQARGGFPGLGSALSAFGYEWGFQHGRAASMPGKMQLGSAWWFLDQKRRHRAPARSHFPDRLAAPVRGHGDRQPCGNRRPARCRGRRPPRLNWYTELVMRPPPPNYGPYSSEQGALQAIVDRLVADLKPFRIYLFGSRAAGRARPDSDFDLVVVFGDNAPNSEADYDEVFAPVVDLPIGCDVIPSRWSDFQEYWRTPPIPGRTLGVPPAESMSVQRRGLSVECAMGLTVAELSELIPHSRIGVTTVSEVRRAGGDVIRTSGRSPHHATLTGLTPAELSRLLTPALTRESKKERKR